MILSATKLAIGYPRQVVHRDLDVSLQPGQFVCLVGPNGVGKSTLLRTLAGLQPPLDGQVHLAGRQMTRLRRVELARELAVVLTERVDPGRLSVAELVGLGRYPRASWVQRTRRHDQQVVAECLAVCGITALASRSVAQLSDGQRQRVMIARALAQEPRVLLLDEPTSFLDPPGKLIIFELLSELTRSRNLAVVVCTHDVSLAARYAEMIWVLSSSGLATGAPEDLMLSGALAAPFEEDGLTFDLETLHFVGQRTAKVSAWVSGEEPRAQLARHMLRRAGYQITAQQPAIQVVANRDGWLLGERQFTSLAGLYEAAVQLT